MFGFIFVSLNCDVFVLYLVIAGPQDAEELQTFLLVCFCEAPTSRRVRGELEKNRQIKSSKPPH